jgi:WD40 repeat protein
VTSSIDFNLKVWDVSTGKEKTTLTGHMAGINSMSYSVSVLTFKKTNSFLLKVQWNLSEPQQELIGVMFIQINKDLLHLDFI